MNHIHIFLILFALWKAASAARILAFFPMPWRSHQGIFGPLVRGLAQKGHQVDFYTPLPIKDPPKTLKQFVVTDWHDEAMALIDKEGWETQSNIKLITTMSDIGVFIMEKTFTHDQVSIDLLASNRTYEAVITEFPVFSEGTIYLAHKFKGLSLCVLGYFDDPWLNKLSGLPDNPSYMTSYFNGLTDKMSFTGRLYNFYTTTSIVLTSAYSTWSKQQTWADKRLRYEGWESRPNIMDMISETALYLVNSHVSSGYPYPKAPHVKEISGTHIDPKPLPKDLQGFMDDATDGVIFFSLGSILDPAELLSKGTFDVLVNVFKSLKQKVLWKLPSEGVPPVNDPNIKIQSWFPQQGILYHKNIKLFITHGGLQSTVEAISAAVPCLGIPFLFDQQKDVAFMVNAGMALKLSFDNITEDNLRSSIDEVLHNPKYRANAKKQQALFLDRPRKPVDEAVYWIEYVIRHGKILVPASVKMPFYQLFLIDVMAFLIGCAMFVMWSLKKFLAVSVRLVCPSTQNEVLAAKKKN